MKGILKRKGLELVSTKRKTPSENMSYMGTLSVLWVIVKKRLEDPGLQYSANKSMEVLFHPEPLTIKKELCPSVHTM